MVAPARRASSMHSSYWTPRAPDFDHSIPLTFNTGTIRNGAHSESAKRRTLVMNVEVAIGPGPVFALCWLYSMIWRRSTWAQSARQSRAPGPAERLAPALGCAVTESRISFFYSDDESDAMNDVKRSRSPASGVS